MKKLLNLVLKNSNDAFLTLQSLKSKGYNATVASTESLRHAFESSFEDHHFLSLRHIENETINESVLCLFVVEESALEELKELIRTETNNFQRVKGFMFSQDITDFEGSI